MNTFFIVNENLLHGLSIIARVEFNGTAAQCLVNGGLSDESDIVSLSVQGKYLASRGAPEKR